MVCTRSSAVDRGYVMATPSKVLLQEARVMVIRRGGEFSLHDAVTEGLKLWVERERARPRPGDNDQRFAKSLRLMCCALLSKCFDQLQAVVKPDGALTSDPERRREAIEARLWMLSDDRDHPLSYLNCCDVLDLPAARGRRWAAPWLERVTELRVECTPNQTPF